MSSREKVIKWLEYDYFPHVRAYRKDCKQGCDACMPMHDKDDYCDIDMLCKVLALLKEQEAIKPKYIDGKRNHFIKCGKCNTDLMKGMKYCSQCGQAVKWE